MNLGILTCGATLVMVASAADQPQWGQAWSRNMVSAETNLPDAFDPKTGRNVKWTATLGSETYSTPVVAGGRVYIGTNNDHPRDPKHQGDRGVLMCFDEKTGQFLWQLVVPKLKTSVYWDWPNTGICSPATVEGDRVYVVSNRGEVMCLDAHGLVNGNDGPFLDEARHQTPPGEAPLAPGNTDADILWLTDLIKECGVRQHDSAHASILSYGPCLYVNTSNGVDDTHRHIAAPEAPSLVALDKVTGRLVARDDEHIGPRIFHCTWSSPSLVQVNGKPLIIFGGGDGVVYAFEPAAEGGLPPPGTVVKLRKVWRFDGDPNSPKDQVHRFNGNRKESPSNITGVPVVYQNQVYVNLGGDFYWGKNQAWLKCIDLTLNDDSNTRRERWSYSLERHCMSSPAVAQGLAFVGDCGRRIHCVDGETGTVCWTHEVRGEIWASPLVADGKVYFATRRGEFLVFVASREKRPLTELDLEQPIISTPIAANGVLYVATMSRLYAIQQRHPITAGSDDTATAKNRAGRRQSE